MNEETIAHWAWLSRTCIRNCKSVVQNSTCCNLLCFFLEYPDSLGGARGLGGLGGLGDLGGLPAEGGAAAAESRGDAGAEQQGQGLREFYETFSYF